MPGSSTLWVLLVAVWFHRFCEGAVDLLFYGEALTRHLRSEYQPGELTALVDSNALVCVVTAAVQLC